MKRSVLGGGVDGMRSRTDFAGSTSRLKRRTRKREEFQRDTEKRSDVPTPKAPPLTILLDDLADEFAPAPIYGQYPKGLIAKVLPWLLCRRHEIVHVCSGALPKGEGVRVDIRPEARPDVLADGRHLPFADGSQIAVMLDPPYCKEYAESLYGIDYPTPKDLLVEATRVVRPGGRIAFVHYITPKPVEGMRFVRSWGLSIGFNFPMRAVTVYERDQPRLAL